MRQIIVNCHAESRRIYLHLCASLCALAQSARDTPIIPVLERREYATDALGGKVSASFVPEWHPEWYTGAGAPRSPYLTRPLLRLIHRQQHYLGRARQPQLHAVQGRQPRPRRLTPRYKAVGGVRGGLHAFKSTDGIRWSLMTDERVITRGAFDSPNLAFWDAVTGRVQGVPPRLPRRRGRTGQPERPRHQDLGLQGLPELARPGVADDTRRAASASSTPTRSSRTTARRTSSSASRPGTPTGGGPSRRRRCPRSSTAGSAAAGRSGKAPR